MRTRFNYKLGVWQCGHYTFNLGECTAKFEKWYKLKCDLLWLLTVQGSLVHKDVLFYVQPGNVVAVRNANGGAVAHGQNFNNLSWHWLPLTAALIMLVCESALGGEEVFTLVRALKWVLARDATVALPTLLPELPCSLCLVVGGYLSSDELPPNTIYQKVPLHWPTATATDVLHATGWSRFGEATIVNAEDA
jgi:hypothetical protein